MFFSKSNITNIQTDVSVAGEKEKLWVVSELKYLIILFDSKVSFKSQIQKVCGFVSQPGHGQTEPL